MGLELFMEKKDEGPLWVPNKDPRGRPVNRLVVREAQVIWKRVLAHVDRRTHDTSRAAEIMEATVFTVSRVMERRVIRNLRSFLFKVFLRKFGRSLRKEKRNVSLESLTEAQLMVDWVPAFEDELEVEVFLRRMDARIQTMFSLRSAGYSWKKIGEELGLAPHNAEAQFSYKIRRGIEKLFRGNSPKLENKAKR
jgi:DNA-directed RNA polymerase specialized sigma24 family protein